MDDEDVEGSAVQGEHISGSEYGDEELPTQSFAQKKASRRRISGLEQVPRFLWIKT